MKKQKKVEKKYFAQNSRELAMSFETDMKYM